MSIRTDREGFAREILEHDNILILTHSHPDADTAGTGVALYNALCASGKNVAVACTDELPEHIKFVCDFADGENLFFGKNFEEKFSPSYIVSVDVASDMLIGNSLREYAQNISLALDHHDINSLSCSVLFDEEFSSSAGETLYFTICEMEKISGKKLINKNTACALYAAVASDSGNFKFSNTSGRTMRCAGDLIELGADNAEISRKLLDIKSLGTFRAEALCTQNVCFFAGGKIAFSFVPRSDLASAGIDETELDTCVQLLRMIEGVEVAVFAKEKTGDDGVEKYRLSMRSNEYADVAKICAEFDGGGHKKAAGCTVFGTLSEVVSKVVSAVVKEL